MSDSDLHNWIENLQEEELRGVIRYLVLLNADAVHNAMNYTLQQKNRQTYLSPSKIKGKTPPLLTKENRRIGIFDNADDDMPRYQSSSQRTAGVINFTPNPQNSSATPETTLVVLCSMKPLTKQEAINQDEAMALCKDVGVLPYIILAESKPEKLAQLLSISHLTNEFPQFFLSDLTSGSVEFLGNFDMMLHWNKVGVFMSKDDLLKLSSVNRKLFDDVAPSGPVDILIHTPESHHSLSELENPNCANSENNISDGCELEEESDEASFQVEMEEEENHTRNPRRSLEPPASKDMLPLQNHNRQEPPAKSPPITTAKAKRRGLRDLSEKPEPSPGGRMPIFELGPLEPSPSNCQPNLKEEAQLQQTPIKSIGHPVILDESTTPVWMENLQPMPESPLQGLGREPEKVHSEVEKETPSDSQLLSLLEGVGACYLVYDDALENLNIYYSEYPMDHCIGVWTSPDILDFKEAQGLSESEFIGNCASDSTSNQANYFKGWSQFVKAAKSMNGTVIKLSQYGLPIEFYLYVNNEGDPYCEKVSGIQFDTANVDAVACLPNNTAFCITLRGRKWSKAAKKLGAVATFNSLVHNVGANSGYNSVPSSPVSRKMKSQNSSTPEENSKLILYTNPTDEEADNIHEQPEFESSEDLMPEPAKVQLQAEEHSVPLAIEHLDSSTSINLREGYQSSITAPSPTGGACYLVYEPDSSGRLVEHYSRTPVEYAIGRWVPGEGKKIAAFKFKQNHGRNVLIGNCSAGVQGRKNYCSGWNQFVRSAKVYRGEVMLWDPPDGVKGMNVDVWFYHNDRRPSRQSQKLDVGIASSCEGILAVATIPKNMRFYDGISVDLLKWLADGSNSGASSKFE